MSKDKAENTQMPQTEKEAHRHVKISTGWQKKNKIKINLYDIRKAYKQRIFSCLRVLLGCFMML